MEFIRLWVWILIILGGVILFPVLAHFSTLWTERDSKKIENILGGAMVSFMYTFRIFLLAVFVFSVIYLIVTNT